MVQEANKLNIPVIAIVDSNNSFEGVDYMIPGNDDSMSSIELFVKSISKIISTTKGKFVKPSTSDSKESQKTMSAENTKTIKKKQIIDIKNEDVRSKNNSTIVLLVDSFSCLDCSLSYSLSNIKHCVILYSV